MAPRCQGPKVFDEKCRLLFVRAESTAHNGQTQFQKELELFKTPQKSVPLREEMEKEKGWAEEGERGRDGRLRGREGRRVAIPVYARDDIRAKNKLRSTVAIAERNRPILPVHDAVLNDNGRLTPTRDEDNATSASVRFGKPTNVTCCVDNIVSTQLIGSRVRLGFVSVAEHNINERHDLSHSVFVRMTSVRGRQRQRHVSVISK